MKAHLWLVQFADTLLQLSYAYNEEVQVYGMNLTNTTFILRRSFMDNRLSEFKEEFRKPMKLFEKSA
mgnify:CR=1 FL=1